MSEVVTIPDMTEPPASTAQPDDVLIVLLADTIKKLDGIQEVLAPSGPPMWATELDARLQDEMARTRAMIMPLVPVVDEKKPWWKDWRIVAGVGAIGLALIVGVVHAAFGSKSDEVALMRSVDRVLEQRVAQLPKDVVQQLDSAYQEHRFAKLSERKKGK